MRTVPFRNKLAALACSGFVFASAAMAATSPTTPDNAAVRTAMLQERVKTIRNKMPVHAQNLLSAGAQNMLNLAEGRTVQLMGAGEGGAPLSSDAGVAVEAPLAAGKVSDPAAPEDKATFIGGFTQSETSTARCGNNVVSSFNDSGSFVKTRLLSPSPSPSGSWANSGFSSSTDAGATFTDHGALVADPLPADSVYVDLWGDPVTVCKNANTFFVANIADNHVDTNGDGVGDVLNSAIGVNKSTNGGVSFGGVTIAAQKNGNKHFLDKAWLAIDFSNKNKLYITYTDFDFSYACGKYRSAIEVVRSIDGGATWSKPVLVSEICSSTEKVQGPQVAVGPGGKVYVAWEYFAPDGIHNKIQLTRSDDGGATFGAVSDVDADVISSGVTLPPDSGLPPLLKGRFRTAEFPSLAVGSNGVVHIVYQATTQVVRDAAGLDLNGDGKPDYGVTDVFYKKSTDRGATWSARKRVNKVQDHDQFMPAIAVDHKSSNKLGVCFYDRRNSANNLNIDRFCATSADNGNTWSNQRITAAPFPPVAGKDLLFDPVYMGDYDTVASDFLRTAPGFLDVWGDNSAGNPDVKAKAF